MGKGKSRYLMGIDLGTTGARAVLIDDAGRVAGKSECGYPLLTPRPGWAEQEPSGWWEAVKKSTGETIRKAGINPGSILCVGLTGQMHGAVFLDKTGASICPAILWCDQRTGKECAEITGMVGAERIFEITANPVLTGFQAPKILWLRNNSPELYSRIRKVLLPKDYIRFMLTGDYATDVSDASGTSMLDVGKRKWSAEILEKTGIPAGFLPECYESGEITGKISKKAGEETGLPAGTPVVAGAGDQAAGGIGSGIVEKGLLSLSLGTSGVLFGHSDTLFTDRGRRLHTFCHAVAGKWHLMGVMLSAGGSFRWLRDKVLGIPYGDMASMSEEVPEGSEGLIFLPYLSGERCPYPDPAARGVFFGLSLKHGRGHLARAVMEGIAFGLKDIFVIMKETGMSACETVRISGGGARSDEWCRMISNIFNCNIARLSVEEGPAYGAAILAGTGSGVFENIVPACRMLVREEEVFTPESEKASLYMDYYGIYRKLYPDLRERFDSLSKIV